MTVSAREPAIHPLDPLSAEELERAVRILRDEGDLGDATRLIALELLEPDKHALGGEVARRAFAVLLEPDTARTREVVMSLAAGAVESRTDVPGVHPAIHPDEAVEAEAHAVAMTDDIDRLDVRGDVSWHRADVLRTLGRGGEADEALRVGIEAFERNGFGPSAEMLRGLLARA